MNTAYSYVERLNMAAVSLSAIAVPIGANAALVTVNDQPLSMDGDLEVGGVAPPGFRDTVATWDVDGVNGPEFALNRSRWGATDAGGYHSFFAWGFRNRLENALAYGTALNGLGFVGPSPPLVSSALVGATLSVYQPAFHPVITATNGYARQTVYYWAFHSQRITVTSSYISGSHFGQYNIGFAFTSGVDIHYGWAVLDFMPSPDNRLTVLEWTYEDMPDTPVHVGTRAAAVPVPEPASSLPAITMLALGAAGVRAWRKHKAAD